MTRLTIIAVLILAFAAPTAVAQDPVKNGYGGNGPEKIDEIPPPDGDVEGDEGDGGGAGVAGSGNDDGNGGGSAQARSERGADTPSAGGSLPFTGLDVGLIVVGGLLMLGVGLGVRRLASAGA